MGEYKRDGIEFSRVLVEKGRDNAIGSVRVHHSEETSWDLSPDASTIAIVTPDEVRFIGLTAPGPTLSKAADTSIRRVQALHGAAWSPDSRAIYTFSSDGRGTTLFLIGTGGEIRTLWRTDTHAETPVPSPDGRHVAFANWTAAENVWLIHGQ